MKREVIALVAAILVVDALFITGYFAGGLIRASGTTKIVYTGIWTVVTLLVVLRGLVRIRGLRSGPPDAT